MSVLIAPPAPTMEAAAPAPVPQRFWVGDRIVRWKADTGTEIRRDEAAWRFAADSPRQVNTSFGDVPVRAGLSKALGDQRMRFVPRYVSAADPLPGLPVKTRAGLESIALDADTVIPFVASFGDCRGFWGLRDLTDEQAGADAALFVPAVMPVEQMREALAVMLDEYPTAASFHRPSGRFYARYETWGDYEDGGRPRVQLRTFVYVLAAPSAPEGR
jgi:hypothetical protein